MKKTFDIHVKSFIPLKPPEEWINEIPLSKSARQTIIASRESIHEILLKKDPRLLVIVGPCSIHDEKAAMEYAVRLSGLSQKVKDSFHLVMRVYFDKPRTSLGWKGMINDPMLDGSCDVMKGLGKARNLLLAITERGVPTATEMLDPITPQYIADLLCWSAIGARTTESQTHREMASGLSMPVGFKNSTDGDLMAAVNAMRAAGSPQQFIGIDSRGRTCIVKTRGNPWTHMVMRGGNRPNYDTVSIQEALRLLKKKGLPQVLMVDCSHSNSAKDYRMQPVVWQDAINQRLDGNNGIIGLMLESNLFEGHQKNEGDLSTLKYGVSITDACISWDTTERLILSAHGYLKNGAGKPVRYRVNN